MVFLRLLNAFAKDVSGNLSMYSFMISSCTLLLTLALPSIPNTSLVKELLGALSNRLPLTSPLNDCIES